jgi:hypothetical protein
MAPQPPGTASSLKPIFGPDWIRQNVAFTAVDDRVRGGASQVPSTSDPHSKYAANGSRIWRLDRMGRRSMLGSMERWTRRPSGEQDLPLKERLQHHKYGISLQPPGSSSISFLQMVLSHSFCSFLWGVGKRYTLTLSNELPTDQTVEMNPL